ncbi:S8 family serine peptidase [Stackebrandtia albiflava]|nr:S8 family serine peptidase [Stackebrandtia albiflava]
MTPDQAIDAKVDPDVVSTLAEQGETSFWVKLDSRADLSAAKLLTDKDAKTTAVYEALTSHARETQADLIDLLKDRGAEYKSHWIANTIKVTGDVDLLGELAMQVEVATVESDAELQAVQPLDVKPTDVQPNGVEWGLDNIKAPQTWAEFGALGDDIVVANIDSGAQFDHPALVDNYRGNNGDGTFTHDYNYADPGGYCGADPVCTTGDHGSHTMGTMMGDDGQGNQIGVAPNAKWIATVGCGVRTCSLDALMGSGEWIVAPTKLDGSDPDPTMAPDIVNNSWGGSGDDPFYEEIVDAWAAAGIFGAWSAGNDGEFGCETNGAPGLYPQSFASGAYDVNNEIAYFSSRGPGRDGQIKPDLAAPGVAVRSAYSNGGYGLMSGTSMASPHTAGVVALMWSVAPALRGDIDATWEILETTARDTENLECGGTAADNNVFGEGRLDAYAAVASSPRDGVGSLTGAVTSEGTALAGASVTADGESMDRTTVSNADGQYLFGALSPGEYAVTVSKFGYITEVASVTIGEDEDVVADFDLDAAPSGAVSGVVTDGSGQGWPMYAKVTAVDTGVSTYTDPETGEYALDLPAGDYALTVEPVYPGYTTANVDVTTGQSADVALTVDVACTAPGYELDYSNLPAVEGFDATTTPEGWTVVDRGNVAMPWRFDNPDGRDNLTGGEGNFAIADSDAAGSGETFVDTDLISPAYDLTQLSTAGLSFKSDFRDLGTSEGSVSISVDGGETWTELWATETSRRGPTTEEIDLSAYADQTAAQFKFWYTDGTSYAWWWQIDDFQLGLPDCVATGGGLVVGHVIDNNTGSTLDGATVTDTVTGASGTSAATPDDANLADGFYWLYTSETGAHDFTASRTGWTDTTASVDVVDSGVVGADFVLGAGRLEVSTTSVDTNVTMGGSWTEEVELTNTGTAPVTVEVGEGNGGFTPQSGYEATNVPLDAPADKASAAESKDVAGAPAATSTPDAEGEWSPIANYPAAVYDAASATHDGTTYVVAGVHGSSLSNKVYAYNAIDDTWEAKANLPKALELPTATFIDGLLYVYGGTTGTTQSTLYIYDPATDAWTEGASGPEARWAAGAATVGGQLYIIGGCVDGNCASSTDVQRYDPASDTWETLSAYPESTAYIACGGVGDAIVCAGGYGDATSDSTYVYNANADEWTEAATMPTDVWGAASAVANGQLIVTNGAAESSMVLTNATYAYDLASDTWTELAPSGQARYRTTGACGFVKVGGRMQGNAPTVDSEMLEGYGDCAAGAADLPWLSTDSQTVTIAPGDSVTLEVTTSGKAVDGVDQPGSYTGALTLKTNTPYGNVTIDVSMTVAPKANMGKMLGTVTGVNCDGTTTPIANAQVQVRGPDGTRYDLTTDADGYFSYWFKKGQYTVIVSKDGWAADFNGFRVKAGRSVTADFSLGALGCTTGLSQIS